MQLSGISKLLESTEYARFGTTHSDQVSPLSIGMTVGVPENENAEVGTGVCVGNRITVGIGTAEGSGVAVEVAVGIAVGIAVCVSAIAVPAMDKAVSMARVGCVLGVGKKLLQEVNTTTARSDERIVLPNTAPSLLNTEYCPLITDH